ncbi:MerR family transcriptional regulator [Micromonospora maris]|uniref:MerR family transcriptional regulator n=1 Tax=Micromonospora maris TaxID=1003110 RepID=A0A9X0LC95_9ACTN|nr:MerR family transcriptional regulator [Micromonospora maris]AEB45485.1 MerR family transcriptional regulator [Micromonospora maris AB-18-032]KUJ44859.1 MerR family transcriptional regulator [Micromonospora maris]
MWRIGELARMTGATERALRHYDKIGLLVPTAIDRTSGYRWYGVAALSRLERIRGLQRLGLSLRDIADLIDAPEVQVRQAVRETVADIRRRITALDQTADRAEDYLDTPAPLLPQQATVGTRHLRVRHLEVTHPGELAAVCAAYPTSTLLTWLRALPHGGFNAAVDTGGTGERLTLPARTVVRAVIPPATGIIDAGQHLFAWLHRHHLAIAGPTVEDHLSDADGDHVTVLEVPIDTTRPAATPTGRPKDPLSTPDKARETTPQERMEHS